MNINLQSKPAFGSNPYADIKMTHVEIGNDVLALAARGAKFQSKFYQTEGQDNIAIQYEKKAQFLSA